MMGAKGGKGYKGGKGGKGGKGSKGDKGGKGGKGTKGNFWAPTESKAKVISRPKFRGGISTTEYVIQMVGHQDENAEVRACIFSCAPAPNLRVMCAPYLCTLDTVETRRA